MNQVGQRPVEYASECVSVPLYPGCPEPSHLEFKASERRASLDRLHERCQIVYKDLHTNSTRRSRQHSVMGVTEARYL